jgi:hypothetical protein
MTPAGRRRERSRVESKTEPEDFSAAEVTFRRFQGGGSGLVGRVAPSADCPAAVWLYDLGRRSPGKLAFADEARDFFDDRRTEDGDKHEPKQ